MGNNQEAISQGEFRKNWKKSDNIDNLNIWTNRQDPKHLLEEYSIHQDSSPFSDQLNAARKNSHYLVNAYPLDNENSSLTCGQSKRRILIERIPVRLSNVRDIPYPDLLHLYDSVLNGFEQLAQIVGFFMVDGEEIGISDRGQIKVWLNPAFEQNYRLGGSVGQKQMILQLLQGLNETVDPQTFAQNNVPNLHQFLRNHQHTIDFHNIKASFNNYVRTYNNSQIPQHLNCVHETGGTPFINNWCRYNQSYGYQPSSMRMSQKLYQSKRQKTSASYLQSQKINTLRQTQLTNTQIIREQQNLPSISNNTYPYQQGNNSSVGKFHQVQHQSLTYPINYQPKPTNNNNHTAIIIQQPVIIQNHQIASYPPTINNNQPTIFQSAQQPPVYQTTTAQPPVYQETSIQPHHQLFSNQQSTLPLQSQIYSPLIGRPLERKETIIQRREVRAENHNNIINKHQIKFIPQQNKVVNTQNNHIFNQTIRNTTNPLTFSQTINQQPPTTINNQPPNTINNQPTNIAFHNQPPSNPILINASSPNKGLLISNSNKHITQNNQNYQPSQNNGSWNKQKVMAQAYSNSNLRANQSSKLQQQRVISEVIEIKQKVANEYQWNNQTYQPIQTYKEQRSPSNKASQAYHHNQFKRIVPSSEDFIQPRYQSFHIDDSDKPSPAFLALMNQLMINKSSKPELYESIGNTPVSYAKDNSSYKEYLKEANPYETYSREGSWSQERDSKRLFQTENMLSYEQIRQKEGSLGTNYGQKDKYSGQYNTQKYQLNIDDDLLADLTNIK